jgi:hypothetical protein
VHVRADGPTGDFQPDSSVEHRVVRRLEASLDGLPEIRNERTVKVRKELGVFQIGVHPGKR